MRFREFATQARPVLKISQQANTPATPLLTNTPPTADDIALAFFRYGEAQSRADADYERTYGVPSDPDRRAKRDQ